MVANKVFVLGVEGFPSGGARIEKLKLIGKSLQAEGCKIHFVINTWSRFKKNELPSEGEENGITYHYSSGITYRPDSFLSRRYIKFKGLINEVLFLLRNKCDVAIVSVISGMFFPILKYWLISRLKGYKIYYPHHEEESAIKVESFIHKVNLFFFKRFAWRFLDGALPISTFLENKIKERRPVLPTLIIPALVDFEIFNNCKSSEENIIKDYYLYCGSYYYFDIIIFIIQSFERIDNHEYKLYLICSGEDEKRIKLEERIKKSPKSELIILYGFLSYEELVEKYLNAFALLIPLKGTLPDIARFPHKVGEYSASKRPIIATDVGDLSRYFKNLENIIFARSFDVVDFSNAMQYVIQNPEKSELIGLKGFEVGLKYFNYFSYGERLADFMDIKKSGL